MDADTSTAPDTTIAAPASDTPSTNLPSTEAQSSPEAATPAPVDPRDRSGLIREALKESGRDNTEGKSLRERMIERGVIKPAATAGERPRAPDGKFAPKAAEQPATAAPAAPAAVAPAPEQPPAPKKIPMPKALRAELAPLWEQAPGPLAEAFAKYVEDAGKGIEKYKGSAAQAEAILNEFKPYEALIRAEGGTPQGAIRDLMNTSYILRTGTPAQKAQLVVQTMARFGISPEMVGQAMQGGGEQQQAASDPRYDQLAQQVQSLSQLLNGQQERHYTSIADSFGRDKPHWALLKPHVAQILQSGEIEGAETMNETEILDAAYNRALQQYPVISQAQAEAERQAALKAERDRANAAALQARAASVQVTGAPGGAAPPAFDPKDRTSVLRHAMRVHSR